MENKSIWFTWEDHRRSRELAAAFNCEYVCYISKRNRLFRYIHLTFKTFFCIKDKRPSLVFCQNPSVILALFLCLFKDHFGYTLVVDRHSNFKFSSRNSWRPIWVVFHWISDFSLKRADITIVTNPYLRDFVNSMGGCAYVLPDKIPQLLDGVCYPKVDKKKEITFISTFSEDEPIFEVVKAASILSDEYVVYVTGSYKKFKNLDQLKAQLPANVVLTGFLPESDYQSRLVSSDAILVVTTSEHTLTCGAYEAVALGKPMVLGNTKAIIDFFNKGAVYTEIDPQKIAKNIIVLFNNLELYQTQVAELKDELESDWKYKFDDIANKLGQFSDGER